MECFNVELTQFKFGFIQDDAYYKARSGVLKALVTAGADINTTDWIDEDPPLFLAVKEGDIKMILILVLLGANLTFRNKNGLNAAELATSLNEPGIARFL